MKLKLRILILLLIIGLLSGAGILYFREGALPVDKNDSSKKIFVIQKGEGLTTIANKLEKEGLIRSKLVFFAVVKMQKIEKNLEAGVFRLSPAMNIYRLSGELTHGSLDISITLIEGQRKEEMATIISQNLGLPESEFNKTASEGYLFPDTYFMPRNADAETVIAVLTKNFNRRFAQAKKESLQKNRLKDEEIITLASLVEREALYDEDRPRVAAILLRRIKEGHKLQVDATVQYALGYQIKEQRWWKKETTLDDLKIDSPYNTYVAFGLPPTPICNPGLASIKAARAADGNTPYLFYISDKKGHLHYARNSDEHQANIDKYLK